jgi:hypothetical protein
METSRYEWQAIKLSGALPHLGQATLAA